MLSERKPDGEQNTSEVLRSLSERDGASASGGGASGGIRDYYEAWHEPARTFDELENTLHSPNYHSAVKGLANAAAVQPPKKKRKTERKRSGKAVRAVLFLLACCVAGAACGAAAAEWRADRILKDRAETREETAAEESDAAWEPARLTPSADTAGAEAEGTHAAAAGTELSAEEIYEIACRQSVGIQVTATGYNIFGQPVTSSPVSGSGFVVSEDGYVVTNYHVIESATGSGRTSIKVQTYDGSSYDAEVTGYDAAADIAVLKIEAGGLSPITAGSMKNCRVGNRVYAVGNPLGELTYTMTDGIICALDRVITTETSYSINVFQINAAVNRGNSGGPVYNGRGEVIGIVDAKFSATGVEGIGFAIPLDDAIPVIRDLIEKGYVTGRAYLGVSMRTVTGAIAAYYDLPRGAYVEAVASGSCAERAGLQAGDIITRIGGYDVTSVDDVRKAKAAYGAGDTVEILFSRNRQEFSLELTFDEDPPSVPSNTG